MSGKKPYKMKRILSSIAIAVLPLLSQAATIWQIGKADNSSADLALGPSDYEQFLAHDFGYEDRYFLIGHSVETKDFPYVLPGPADAWGGTGGTSGWRTHEDNILFAVSKLPSRGTCHLYVALTASSKAGSLLKVTINNFEHKFRLAGVSDKPTVTENVKLLDLPFDASILKKGGNQINLTVLEGGWVSFDYIRLEGPSGISLSQDNGKAFLRSVAPANYQISNAQPLLVDAETLKPGTQLSIRLDGKDIFTATMDTARYVFEAPMPAVSKKQKSQYIILADGMEIDRGTIWRSPQPQQTKADYVDTRIGTAHSRWMIAPGPWMPFGMVKLSPDNQNTCWQAGYQPTFESIGCFSHIHEWTMAGVGLMPTNGKLFTKVGDELHPDKGYRSRIDKQTEEAPLGHYKVYLSDTHIWAEGTATERASLMRYTFPKDTDGRVMIDLHIPAEYDYQLVDVSLKQTSPTRIEGISHQLSPRPHVWSNDADQEYTVHFVIEFDAPIKRIGAWKNDEVIYDTSLEGHDLKDAGMFVEFDTKQHSVVQVRTGISLVSVENAAENLNEEISKPFGWDYNAVVQHQKDVWNDILDRLDITTNDRLEKVRFYTNVYRALGRNTWSDVNGQWVSADEQVRQLPDKNLRALGGDAFWNTFWNLNQLWNLVTPEWSSRWVQSELAMYDTNGWLAKGPAGMEYIPVMVAEHEIPLMVSAWQMGIRDFDGRHVLEAATKMQTTPAQPVAGGFAGNRDLVAYMRHHYVPYDKGRFSNTLEYSFDDWTVGQLAKSLGDEQTYQTFNTRGYYWRNAINPENGYAHLRDSLGHFVSNFDPFRSGANQHYVEGNAWQLSYFVPQDVPALVKIMGRKAFCDRLEWGFEKSEPWRYNAPGDQYWDFPVVQGNQQSMHFAYLFNWAGKPWLTQRWSRSIADRYYGSGIANAYLGDEDQGQMSSWFVMAALGLFQTDGGTRVNPVYEIASPMFPQVVINLGHRYGRGEQFVIKANNASRHNKYVQSAKLNGKPLNSFLFPASELLKGGTLELEMGPEPNENWGIDAILAEQILSDRCLDSVDGFIDRSKAVDSPDGYKYRYSQSELLRMVLPRRQTHGLGNLQRFCLRAAHRYLDAQELGKANS